MSETAIEVNHVWKKFRKGEMHDSLRELIPAFAKRLVGKGPKSDDLSGREFWALKDVSFELKRGESLGIIGPNGAGKSTMLKLLSRIIKPNRGTYHVNGRLSAMIEVGAGFHQDLTGMENIYLSGTILGMDRAEIKAKEEEIIAFSEVESFIDTPVKRYSSGMKARLGFAIAAHLEPDVLLVDEVLSVGDVKFRQKCLAHMENLLRSDVTIIFISHIIDQVRRLCPNSLVLHHGESIFYGESSEATKVYLSALNDKKGSQASDENCEAEIRNIQFGDEAGREVDSWTAHQSATIRCDLVLHRYMKNPAVVFKVFDVRGMSLATVGSIQGGLCIPSEPGEYRVKFSMDSLPLIDGDYAIQLFVYDKERKPTECVWVMRQPRVISVRGSGNAGSLIKVEGRWEADNVNITESAVV